MTRTDLPYKVRNWLEWLEDSQMSECRVNFETLSIHRIDRGKDPVDSVGISFDVDYFEFLGAIEAFPTLDFYLYSTRINTETVTFQFALTDTNTYYGYGEPCQNKNETSHT